MSFDFKGAAKRQTTVSDLIAGREKVKTDYVIRNYPTGITVEGFDMITSNGQTYPVIVFREDPTKFFCGGTVLTKICLDWVAAFDGDIKGASDALYAAGGVLMKLEAGRTKEGRNVTTVTIL